jgi:uncharacterized protein (TIGR02391 family)
LPDTATVIWGRRYVVARRRPDGKSTHHKAWALDVSDADARFDLKADIRPGDVVTIRQSSGHSAERVVETSTPTLDGRYTRVTWRLPSGAPTALTLTDLHPLVYKAAGQLYLDGHYADAIGAAVKALEIAVRDRAGLGAAPNLMGQAFSDNGPLDLRRHGGRTGADEQQGFRFLFMGMATALRNPRAHEFIDDDPVSALEHLALVSLLYRRLDSSQKRRRRRPALVSATPDSAKRARTQSE